MNILRPGTQGSAISSRSGGAASLAGSRASRKHEARPKVSPKEKVRDPASYTAWETDKMDPDDPSDLWTLKEWFLSVLKAKLATFSVLIPNPSVQTFL